MFATLDGTQVTADDPERGVWYAASGHCGYWTDDWDKLGKNGGIPCCPKCKCVGMQTTAKDWHGGAEKYESAGHPRYQEFVASVKEHCDRGNNGGTQFMTRYQQFVKQS